MMINEIQTLATNSNELAIENAIKVYNLRNGLEFSKVLASIDGSIVLLFSTETKYGDIECFNDGLILAIMNYIDKTKEFMGCWEVNNIAASIEKIQTFLYE